MTTHAQITLLFHGTIILFASMLTGFPLAVAIADGWPPEAIRAWGVTHGSLASTGILLIAIGAAAHHLLLSRRTAALFSWTLLPSAYALSLGLVVSAATGLRGIAPAAPLANVVLYLVNIVGVLGAVVAGALLVHGAFASLRAHAATEMGGDAAVGAHGSPARS